MSLDGHLDRGCLPVAVDPARGVVVLSPLADLGFAEVRYDRSLVMHGRGRPAYLVGIDEFVSDVARRPPPPPAGVIAHVGRCGSTLLANLLGLRPRTLVLKEPGFLLSPDRRLLGALLGWCRLAAAASNRELVVKPSSWACPALSEATAPADTHWLLLWREPAEVVASEVATPPPWADAEDSRAELGRRVDPVPEQPVARYAAHWADVVLACLPRAGRVLDYRAFVSDQAAAVRAVQAWFGLADPDLLPTGFAAEAARYSKGTGSASFDPAGSHRRPGLADTSEAVVRRITGRALTALRDAPALWP